MARNIVSVLCSSRSAMILVLGALLSLIAAACAAPSSATPTPSGPEWTLVWNDEFDGADGSTIDKSRWGFEIGNNSGWGNSELQYYTNDESNLRQSNGLLSITARKEKTSEFDYTSARIKTKGRFEFQYGKIEMRAKLPSGQGIWPAFWLLGGNVDEVGWPTCGEIDIMEHIGREPQTVFGTLHGPEYSGSMGIQGKVTGIPTLAQDFHVYGLAWDADSLVWSLDGKDYFTIEKAKFLKNRTWVTDHEYFIILNLAVGGRWPGYPDESTTFPQTFSIDYVRVYQLKPPA